MKATLYSEPAMYFAFLIIPSTNISHVVPVHRHQ